MLTLILWAQALKLSCRDISEPRVEAMQTKAALCACLGEDCRDLDSWERHLYETLKASPPPGGGKAECLEDRRWQRLDYFYSSLLEACKAKTLKLGPVPREEECRQAISMSDEGCVVTAACDGSARKTLCPPHLPAVHAMKDPRKMNQPYHAPIAQLYLDHPVYRHECCYGQANCHGTAQALAGGILENTPLTGILVPPAYEKECRPIAEAFYKTGLKPDGGMAINMKYEDCGENDCGTAQLGVMWCKDGKLDNAYTFIDGMCIKCWDRKWREHGYRRLETGWRDLRDGCVLTARDHSITMLFQSAGFCYYYESPNPGGAPQLLAQPCPTLYSRFPWRWCPRK